MFDIYQIKERLSFEKLTKELAVFNQEYSGRIVRLKKNGDHYRISHFSVLNQNGTAEYAVNYYPHDKESGRDFTEVKHTRPAREFFDGRFDY